jgi:hypothetical protein
MVGIEHFIVSAYRYASFNNALGFAVVIHNVSKTEM